SRQDEAKLAAGMERDHFRDMLRLTLVRSLALYWLQFEAFIRSRTGAIPQALPVLQNVYPRVHAVAVQPTQASDPALAGNFQATYQPIAAEFINLALGLPPSSQPARQALDDLLARYPERIPLNELAPTVLDALLQLGIPPGGPVHNLIRYWDAQEWLNWFTCYDWQNLPVRVRNG